MSTIQFNDGAAYERGMGGWSQLVGADFLRWLAPPPRVRWVDVGCGNGAFTELVIGTCDPAEIRGIDPSEGQLAFARKRPGTAMAQYTRGDAHHLPFESGSADVGVMALVIFFLDDPAAGLTELRRVVRPGGIVATYAWDLPARAFPLEPVQAELRALGHTPVLPPSAAISSAENLRAAWEQAGFGSIRQCRLPVTRRFPDFDTFWSATLGTGSLQLTIDKLPPEQQATVRDRVRDKLPREPDGSVSYSVYANAIAGLVPDDPAR